MLVIYVFIGSGPDIMLFNDINRYDIGLAFFYHVDNWHIYANTIYFLLLGVLFEAWLKIKQGLHNFMKYYIIPMFIDSAISPIAYAMIRLLYFFIGIGIYVPTLHGWGMSLGIETLSLVLIYYIFTHWNEIKADCKNEKFLIFPIVLAGLSLSSIFNWFIEIIFLMLEGGGNEYILEEAYLHVGWGVIIFIVLFSVKYKYFLKKS